MHLAHRVARILSPSRTTEESQGGKGRTGGVDMAFPFYIHVVPHRFFLLFPSSPPTPPPPPPPPPYELYPSVCSHREHLQNPDICLFQQHFFFLFGGGGGGRGGGAGGNANN